jgi:hypothetical protein
MEPWMDVDAQNRGMGLKMKLRGFCRPVVAASYHLDEEPGPEPL